MSGVSESVSGVALRKESVDRNSTIHGRARADDVALRKESVDRNFCSLPRLWLLEVSLSARRAWIEMDCRPCHEYMRDVALRKESVDRNMALSREFLVSSPSLSARRAWIEMVELYGVNEATSESLSARRAWIEIWFSYL